MAEALRTGGAPASVIRECLSAAVAAPSVHNSQPWRFRLGAEVVDVLVDRRRQVRVLDPDGREMFISVGAAVFNLRVALRARGWESRVRLTPDPAQPDLAATVRIGRAAAAPPAVVALAGAIPRRHTNRRPFADTPIPVATLTELENAARDEGASLLIADPIVRDGVISLTRTAENRMRTDPRYRAELAEWTTPPGIGRRDGVPREAFPPRDDQVALPLRDFALGHGAPTTIIAFEPNPTIVLLFTAGDTSTDWLRAGAALQRVLLTATLRGLAATPLSQLTEIPPLRELLADTSTGGVVQTVLRMGFPTAPAAATARRPLDDVLLAEPDTPDLP